MSSHHYSKSRLRSLFPLLLPSFAFSSSPSFSSWSSRRQRPHAGTYHLALRPASPQPGAVAVDDGAAGGGGGGKAAAAASLLVSEAADAFRAAGDGAGLEVCARVTRCRSELLIADREW